MALSKTQITARLKFRESALARLYEAYEQIASGAVKSYTIDDRTLTRLDLGDLKDEISKMENEIDTLNAQLEGLNGGKSRKAVGVIPCDW